MQNFINNQINLEEEKRKEELNIYPCNHTTDYQNWGIKVKACFKEDKKIVDIHINKINRTNVLYKQWRKMV